MPQGTSTKMVAMSIDPFEVIERNMIYGFMNRIKNSKNSIVKCISNSEFYVSSQLYINWSDMLYHVYYFKILVYMVLKLDREIQTQVLVVLEVLSHVSVRNKGRTTGPQQ